MPSAAFKMRSTSIKYFRRAPDTAHIATRVANPGTGKPYSKENSTGKANANAILYIGSKIIKNVKMA